MEKAFFSGSLDYRSAQMRSRTDLPKETMCKPKTGVSFIGPSPGGRYPSREFTLRE
jgi:hypothetical protein